MKQAKINDVLYDIDDKELEFNVERERDDDDKSSLLEQIDMLLFNLSTKTAINSTFKKQQSAILWQKTRASWKSPIEK